MAGNTISIFMAFPTNARTVNTKLKSKRKPEVVFGAKEIHFEIANHNVKRHQLAASFWLHIYIMDKKYQLSKMEPRDALRDV